jgi:hypothetical protein
VIVNVPVQYYQSVIAIETAVTGVLLFQIRFFDSDADAPGRSASDPRVRVLMLIVLTATVSGSLEAIREGGGLEVAVLVTVGLAVSILPILLRVLPPLHVTLKRTSGTPTSGSPCSASSSTWRSSRSSSRSTDRRSAIAWRRSVQNTEVCGWRR